MKHIWQWVQKIYICLEAKAIQSILDSGSDGWHQTATGCLHCHRVSTHLQSINIIIIIIIIKMNAEITKPNTRT